jgi:hypothetical protein
MQGLQAILESYNLTFIRTYGEMDITTVFGTVILGSNPGKCTIFHKISYAPHF